MKVDGRKRDYSTISAQVDCLFYRQQAASCFVAPVRIEAIVTFFFPMHVLWCIDVTPSGAPHSASQRKREEKGSKEMKKLGRKERRKGDETKKARRRKEGKGGRETKE